MELLENLQSRWQRFVDQVFRVEPDLHSTSRLLIGSLQPLREEDGVLTLSPNNELMVRAGENYIPMILEHLAKLWDKPVREVRLEFDAAAIEAQSQRYESLELPLFAVQTQAPVVAKQVKKKIPSANTVHRWMKR